MVTEELRNLQTRQKISENIIVARDVEEEKVGIAAGRAEEKGT